MATLLKINGRYGAQVGHRTVFTREAAIELYKIFLKEVYGGDSLTQEGAFFRKWSAIYLELVLHMKSWKR